MKRLLVEILLEIDRADGYRRDLTRDLFARDGMRRDAAERCLSRVQAALGRLEEMDPSFPARGRPAALLRSARLTGAVARMDSDVLWGLIDGCCVDLRDAILRVLLTAETRT